MKKVFISYSWDSPEHQQSVLELSNRLRSDGIDCDIDLYYQSPKEGWPRWMERLTRESDYVLVVCTESYLEGFEGKRPPKVGQGVKWESLLTSNDIYYNDSENNKYIPVVLKSADSQFRPRPLESFTFFDLSTEEGYENLYRLITGQPRTVKPPLGDVRILPSSNEKPLPEKINIWEEPESEPEPAKAKKKFSPIKALFIILGGIATISGVLHFFNQPDSVKGLGDKFLNKPVTMASEKLTVVPRFHDSNKTTNKQISLFFEEEEVRKKCNVSNGKGDKPMFIISCLEGFDGLIRFSVEAKGCVPMKDKSRLGIETTTPAITCN